MCGRPAVPSTSARPSDKKSIFARSDAPNCSPGISSRSPSSFVPDDVSMDGLASTASPRSADRSNANRPSTHVTSVAAPTSSRPALMICTQVVPFIPPTST